MKRLGFILIALAALVARGQTRIASDVEIRQMEAKAQEAPDFSSKVSARVSLGELRRERNETAAAHAEFATALQLATEERFAARRDHDRERYALACGWSGVALASLGRGVEAFAILEEAVRNAADVPGVWNLYSVAMFRLNRLEKAIGAARVSVSAAERRAASSASVLELLELNFNRFALAQSLLDIGSNKGSNAQEAEKLLLDITTSLESEAFQSLRKSVSKREEFEIVTAPTTENGMYLAVFNRAHMRLALLYENAGAPEKARLEYLAVVSKRSDEPTALAGLARLTSDAKERDRYLIQSLDANPFAHEVITAYEQHVASGDASPASASGSVGSRVRLIVQQVHDREFRRAREMLKALLEEHPDNDVLQSLLARTELRSGDASAAKTASAKISDYELRRETDRLIRNARSTRPSFLERPLRLVMNPAEADLRVVLSLFAGNTMSAADRATLDQTEFSSVAAVDAPESDAFEKGTINSVPFRFQSASRFRGIAPTSKMLRIVYRILGATAVDGRDALLLEPIRAEVYE